MRTIGAASALMLLVSCSEPLQNVEAPGLLAPTVEGMAQVSRNIKPGSRMVCDVQLQVIKSPMPPGDPVKTWLRATYIGQDCEAGPTYPYYPAPRWDVSRNSVMPWGADPFIAYLWPNVPGDYTVTATAPVGKMGTLQVHVP